MTEKNAIRYWDHEALKVMLKRLEKENFTGSIEIHFTQGGVGKIVKHETIK